MGGILVQLGFAFCHSFIHPSIHSLGIEYSSVTCGEVVAHEAPLPCFVGYCLPSCLPACLPAPFKYLDFYLHEGWMGGWMEQFMDGWRRSVRFGSVQFSPVEADSAGWEDGTAVGGSLLPSTSEHALPGRSCDTQEVELHPYRSPGLGLSLYFTVRLLGPRDMLMKTIAFFFHLASDLRRCVLVWNPVALGFGSHPVLTDSLPEHGLGHPCPYPVYARCRVGSLVWYGVASYPLVLEGCMFSP